MVITNWFSRLSPRERASVVIFLSLLLLGAGLWAGRTWGEDPEQLVVEEPKVENIQEKMEPEQIYVHVCGQVKKPGVYQLPGNSRVFQAIEKAGGPGEKADLEFLNLAQELTDGSKIYLPGKGEAPLAQKLAGSVAESPAAQQPRAAAPKKTLTGKINLNTANSTQLQLLPGVGPAIASRILSHRQSIGRFTSIEQLLDVSGIGPKTLEKLREHLEL